MPAVIDRFARVARYYLDLLPPATCIEQTRIVMECLTDAGCEVRPVECILEVLCPELNLGYLAGAGPGVIARARAAGCHITPPTWNHSGGNPRTAHLVAFVVEPGAGSYVVETTMHQASVPEQGLRIEPAVLSI